MYLEQLSENDKKNDPWSVHHTTKADEASVVSAQLCMISCRIPSCTRLFLHVRHHHRARYYMVYEHYSYVGGTGLAFYCIEE